MENHRSPRNTIVLAGNGPCTNRGCEALLVSTTDAIRDRLPGVRFVSAPEKQDVVPDRAWVRAADIVHRPYSFPAKWSLDSIGMKLRRRTVARSGHPFEPFLGDAKAVLALGGDNFTLDYGPALPRRQLAIGRFAAKQGVPFVVWGASIGPFSANPAIEAEMAATLKEVALITVREDLTLEYLAGLGVQGNVVRVADPAFLLKPEEPAHAPELKALLQERPIAINLSPLMEKYVDGRGSWLERAVELIRAIDRIVDVPIVLLPHVIWTVSDDRAFLGEVQKQIGPTRNRVFLPREDLSCRELKWVIGQLSMLVAARTHATIAAFSQAVPTISIGYSLKAAGINRDLFGDLRWVANVREITPESLALLVERLKNNREEVRAGLAAQQPRLRALAAAGVDALLRVAR